MTHENRQVSTGAHVFRDRMRARGIALFVSVAILFGLAIDVSPAVAMNRSWPSSGWTNPVADPAYEDWGFASCRPPYNGSKAHLGSDSQGAAPAGAPVVALAAGRVTRITPSGWPGAAIGIVHEGSAGRFVAVYGHVNPSVTVGQSVAKGQHIATLYNWVGNTHLHLGIRPISAAENPDNVVLWGADVCVNGFVDTHGYVDPIPWLASRGPISAPPRTWHLRNSNSSGAVSIPAFQYGARDDIPVVGNWDGVGGDTIGVFRPSDATWHLRNYNSSGAVSITTFQYGAKGDIPVVGNWDGVGGDTIGVFRPSDRTWHLRNYNSSGPVSIPVFQYGGAGDLPVAGNWDRVGGDTIGVFRPSGATWHLRNYNSSGPVSIPAFQYGGAGDRPVVGNWDGVGGDTIGVFRPSGATWHLRNSNSSGAVSIPAFQYGGAGDRPVVGNWDGVSGGTIGVFR